MTHDQIRQALEERADEHERTLLDGDMPVRVAVVTTLDRDRPGVRRRAQKWAAVAASAVLAIGVAGSLLRSDDGDQLSAAGPTEASSSDSDQNPGPGMFSEEVARSHLENFIAALNRQDFAAAAESIGGEDMAPNIAEALDWSRDETPTQALERYCDMDLVFCSGLSVGEVAHSDGMIRAFLVVVPIPAGSFGNGEPLPPGAEHSSPLRVGWVDGAPRILDPPPKFDDVWDG